ncbi:MAG TPA: hypothetical protein VGA62_00945 [Acidimicrobiia bacterium]
MARALECPACGAKRRIANLPDEPTFRCDRCGQVLTVPRPAAKTAATAATPTGAVSAGGPPIAPPPRRRPPGASAAPVPAVVGAVSATLPASGVDPPAGVSRAAGSLKAGSLKAGSLKGGAAEADSRRAVRANSARRSVPGQRVSWYWRFLAWILAVPIGFVVTAYPAYHFNLIRKNDVLDVFVGSGIGRYTRLAIGTVVWALVTALLVQLFVEGGHWFMARRRTRRVDAQPSTP